MNPKMGTVDKSTIYRIENRVSQKDIWYRWTNVYDTFEVAQKVIENHRKFSHTYEYRIVESVTKTTVATTDRIVKEYLTTKIEQKMDQSHYVIQFRFKNEPLEDWMVLAGKYSESKIDDVLSKHRDNDQRWDYRAVRITEEVTNK